MEKLFNVVELLIVALSIMSVACPYIIEIIKGIVNKVWIIKVFSKIEVFSIFVTGIIGVIVYIFLMLFFTDIMLLLNLPQRVLIFIIWIICCAVCSQNCYDKVIKWLIGLMGRGK